jgi:hypothetical protein
MKGHLTVCRECHKPIDLRAVGMVRVAAHGRDFCSMKCADVWESNPENAEAVRESYAADCPTVAELLGFEAPERFPVTDDALDAPDGAIVDEYKRIGDQWIRQK